MEEGAGEIDRHCCVLEREREREVDGWKMIDEDEVFAVVATPEEVWRGFRGSGLSLLGRCFVFVANDIRELTT